MSRKLKVTVITSLCIAAAALIALLLSSLYLYASLKSTVNQIYEPVSVNKPIYISKDSEVAQLQQEEQAVETGNRPFTVLVMGIDALQGERGRTDTLIVLGFNPQHRSVLLFNIPRDTYTTIIGRGTLDKINHAFAFGGVEMTLDTVEHFLDYPIDYFVRVDMGGFVSIIDRMGGVEVFNHSAFQSEGMEFPAGQLVLNGKQALSYARMRYEDARGDLGRNERQREITQQLVRKGLRLSSLLQVEELLASIGDHVKTNMTFSEIKDNFLAYRPGLESVSTVELAGESRLIDGIWYYEVSEQERQRIHEQLKNQQTAF